MNTRDRLQDQNSEDLVVLQGKACAVVLTFEDLSDPPEQLTADDLLTIKLTLLAGSTILNSRNAQTVKNANGGTLAADGELTLVLDGNDNSIADGTLTAGKREEHILLIEWTWNDGTLRNGGKEFVFWVQKRSTGAA